MSYSFKGKVSPDGAGTLTVWIDGGPYHITDSSYENLGGGYTWTDIQVEAEANSGYTFSKFTYYLDGGQGWSKYNNPADISVGDVSSVSVIAYFKSSGSSGSGSGSDTSSRYYCYDLTNSTYISDYSNGISFSSSATRPLLTGYTYQGYVWHSSASDAISYQASSGYHSTSTTYSGSSKAVVFFYTKNAVATGWQRGTSYGMITKEKYHFDYVAPANKLDYFFYKPTEDGSVKIYSTGSQDYMYYDDHVFIFKTSEFPTINNANANGSGIFTNPLGYDDGSNASSTYGNRFSITKEVTKDTTYCVVFSNYYIGKESGGIIYIEFTPTPSVTYSFQINYDANGGSNAPSTTSGTSATNSISLIISSNKPSRASSKFLGWSQNKNATKASYQPGDSISISVTGGTLGTITLYAVWEVIPWTLYYQINEIVLNSSGTIVSQTDNVYSNNIPNISTYNYSFDSFSSSYTKEGYSIKAITLSADPNSTSSGISYNAYHGTSSSSSSPRIIYYIFRPKFYTYSFDLNGGSSTTTLNSISGFFNETITIPNVYPTKNDYKFAGWGNNSTTTVSYKPNTSYKITIASNKTLKAVWNRIFYWSNNENIDVGSTTPEFINKYINATRMNVFIGLINLYLNTNLSNVTTTTKITTELYNKIATALGLTNISDSKKIMAEDWNNLQTAFNNKKFTT